MLPPPVIVVSGVVIAFDVEPELAVESIEVVERRIDLDCVSEPGDTVEGSAYATEARRSVLRTAGL